MPLLRQIKPPAQDRPTEDRRCPTDQQDRRSGFLHDAIICAFRELVAPVLSGIVFVDHNRLRWCHAPQDYVLIQRRFERLAGERKMGASSFPRRKVRTITFSTSSSRNKAAPIPTMRRAQMAALAEGPLRGSREPNGRLG
jgi:hypothetical protein